MALQPLGLGNLRIGFFNAFGDDPSRLRSFLFEALNDIRNAYRRQLREDIASARILLANYETEQVREVLRAAATMMRTWVAQHSAVPALTGHVQDTLLAEIQSAYASTVRATIRREGEWSNLDYGHHLGYGARRIAAVALEPAVETLKGLTGVMEANADYREARDLLQQTRRVLETAFEELLRKVQIMGRTAFKDALKLDPSLWAQCEGEWGHGYGYRDRVAEWNMRWFNAEPRQQIENELRDLITREWNGVLSRLSALLEIDGLSNP